MAEAQCSLLIAWKAHDLRAGLIRGFITYGESEISRMIEIRTYTQTCQVLLPFMSLLHWCVTQRCTDTTVIVDAGQCVCVCLKMIISRKNMINQWTYGCPCYLIFGQTHTADEWPPTQSQLVGPFAQF